MANGVPLVPGGFTVPTVPEHVAFCFISEDAVQSFAMGAGDWGFWNKGEC